MNKEETRQVLTVLKINYPHSFKNLNDDETFQFLDLWAEAFKNDSAELVTSAVKSIIYSDEREFAPNIGQVKKRMFEMSGVKQKGIGDAWDIVMRNCSCSYAQVNFDKLPANIQKAIGSPSFLRELGYASNDEVSFFRKEFERKYEVILEREKEDLICGLIDYEQVERNNTLPAPKDGVLGFVKLGGLIE